MPSKIPRGRYPKPRKGIRGAHLKFQKRRLRTRRAKRRTGARAPPYNMFKKLIKKQCLKEQETKYITNGDPTSPGIVLNRGNTTDEMEELGVRYHNITPSIPQIGANQAATASLRLGDEVLLMNWTGRFEVNFENVPVQETANIGGNTHERYGRNFDPSLIPITFYYVQAKKAAVFTAEKLWAALYNERPGANPYDQRLNQEKEFRKQFTILTKKVIMPKYDKYKQIAIYPQVANAAHDMDTNVPALHLSTLRYGVATYDEFTNEEDSFTKFGSGHADGKETMADFVGRSHSFQISHNFRAKRTIYDGSSPRDFNYYLLMQWGDWKYSEIDYPLKFPEILIWNTYTFKDS